MQGTDCPFSFISTGVHQPKTTELKTRVERKTARLPGGLSRTEEDGLIIELEANQKFVHWD